MTAGQVLQEPQQVPRSTPNNNFEECDLCEDQVLAQKAILVLKERADAALRDSNAQEALVLYREIVMRLTKSHVQASKELELLISCYLNISAALCKQKKWQQVIEECNQALQITHEASKTHPTLQIWLGRTYYFRGFAFFSLGQYIQALPDYQAALKHLPKDEAIRQDYEILQRALQVEAQVRIKMKNAIDHFQKNQFALAISECNRALKNSIGLKNLELVGVVHGNMGSIYLKSNNLPKAIEHFKKSLKYTQELDKKKKNVEREFDLLDSLAACYTRQNDLLNAMEAIKKTIALLSDCPSRISKKPSIYLNAGRVLFTLTCSSHQDDQEKNQIKEYFKKVLEMGSFASIEIRLTSLFWLIKIAIRQQNYAEIHSFFHISFQILKKEKIQDKKKQFDQFYLLALKYFNEKRLLKEELTSKKEDFLLLKEATNYFHTTCIITSSSGKNNNNNASISGLLKSIDLLCYFHRVNPSKQFVFLQKSIFLLEKNFNIFCFDSFEENIQIFINLQALLANLILFLQKDLQKANQILFETFEKVFFFKQNMQKQHKQHKQHKINTCFLLQIWKKIIFQWEKKHFEEAKKEKNKLIQILRKLKYKNEKENVFLSDLLVQQAHFLLVQTEQQQIEQKNKKEKEEKALDFLEEARDLLLVSVSSNKQKLLHILVGMCILQLKQNMWKAAKISLQHAKKIVSINFSSFVVSNKMAETCTEEMKIILAQLKALEQQLKPYDTNISELQTQTTKIFIFDSQSTSIIDASIEQKQDKDKDKDKEIKSNTVYTQANECTTIGEKNSCNDKTTKFSSNNNLLGVFFWSALVLAIVLLLPNLPLLY